MVDLIPFHFDFCADIYFIPVSGLTGVNLKDPPSNNECPWYRYVHVHVYVMQENAQKLVKGRHLFLLVGIGRHRLYVCFF